MIYPRTGGLPENKADHERLRRRAGQYTLVNDERFWRGANVTLMKYITPDEGCAILQDIHARICGSHVGARSLTDKFTKWIEVKPVASNTTTKAVEFIKEIMYMFGIPTNIITDNETQFTAREFKHFFADSGIKINYASGSHP
jgi:hypothetical protein